MRTEDYLAAGFQGQHGPRTRRAGGSFSSAWAAASSSSSRWAIWPLAQEAGRQRGGAPGLPSDFNAFLRIGEDGRVTCFTGKIEMGQGPITSLAQMLAEELDVPLDTVDMVMGDTELCPWDMGTFGSMTHALLRARPAGGRRRGQGGPAGAGRGSSQSAAGNSWWPRTA